MGEIVRQRLFHSEESPLVLLGRAAHIAGVVTIGVVVFTALYFFTLYIIAEQ